MIVYRKKVSTQHNSAKQNEKRKTRCRLSLTDVVPAREGDCIHDIIAVDIVPQDIFPLPAPTTPSLVVWTGRPSAAALQSFRHPTPGHSEQFWTRVFRAPWSSLSWQNDLCRLQRTNRYVCVENPLKTLVCWRTAPLPQVCRPSTVQVGPFPLRLMCRQVMLRAPPEQSLPRVRPCPFRT